MFLERLAWYIANPLCKLICNKNVTLEYINWMWTLKKRDRDIYFFNFKKLACQYLTSAN